MVRELEKKAIEYDASNYKNLVLGYIRTINKYYDGCFWKYWPILAGETPLEFISYVNADNSHGVRFNEFFSSFVAFDNDYNVDIHGSISEMYQRNSENLLKLMAPNGNGIDLIHMFASIDGIYGDTGNTMHCGENNQRDILSWNGDLQSACKNLKIKTDYDFTNFDMGRIFAAKIGCSEDDILADIDAMNITKGYIDVPENSIASSLSAYFKMVKDSGKYRYKMFLSTSTIEMEEPRYGTLIENFEYEVYTQFNLYQKNDGTIENYSFFGPLYVGHRIMREASKLNIGTMPSKEIREFVTKSFVKYIEENSGILC